MCQFVVFCMVLFIAVYTHAQSVVSTHGCPDTSGMAGICVEECSSDGDCNYDEGCCSNGCGHTCTKLVQRNRTCTNLECVDNCMNHEVRVLSTDHCATCGCADPSPCKIKSCSERQTCRMVQVQCITAPCPPVAMCVDDPCYMKAICEIGCVGDTAALAQDDYGCALCSCQDYCKDAVCIDDKTCTLSLDRGQNVHGPVYTDCVTAGVSGEIHYISLTCYVLALLLATMSGI